MDFFTNYFNLEQGFSLVLVWAHEVMTVGNMIEQLACNPVVIYIERLELLHPHLQTGTRVQYVGLSYS